MAKQANRKSEKSRTALTRQGKWKPIFLKRLSETASVIAALKTARVNSETAYRHRKEDAEFAAGWERALLQASELVIEEELHRRGVKGWDEPVFGSGGRGSGTVQVGKIRRYSDACLIFRAKKMNPAFREKAEPAPQGGNTTNVNIVISQRLAEATEVYRAVVAGLRGISHDPEVNGIREPIYPNGASPPPQADVIPDVPG